MLVTSTCDGCCHGTTCVPAVRPTTAALRADPRFRPNEVEFEPVRTAAGLMRVGLPSDLWVSQVPPSAAKAKSARSTKDPAGRGPDAGWHRPSVVSAPTPATVQVQPEPLKPSADTSSGGFGTLCFGVLALVAAYFLVRAFARSGTPSAKQQVGGSGPVREAPRGSATWIEPATTVRIAGRTIPGGFLYVGETLSSLSNPRAAEPALINPRLTVAEPPNRTGAGMPYWPSYTLISPQCRAAFLDWLAGGRRDPSTAIGYVFIFFYGLERRALAGEANRPGELSAIEGEVRRLLSTYGQNRSFSSYANRFLSALASLSGRQLLGGGMADEQSLQVAVGQCAQAQRAIPADLALAIARNDEALARRKVLDRCASEFDALFKIRYREQHGEGLIPDAIKTSFQPQYQPASSSFGGPVKLSATPVPRAAKGSLQKVVSVGEDCADALEGYGRHVARHGATNAELLSRVALLPVELIADHGGRPLQDLKGTLSRHLAATEFVSVEANSILDAFRVAPTEKVPKPIAVELAAALQALGFGFEPDVRFGGPTLQPGAKVVLFRWGAEAPTTPTSSYSSGVALLNLAMVVAGADGVVSSDEEALLTRHVEDGLELSPEEQRRLKAHVRWLRDNPPKASRLDARLAKVAIGLRETIARFLVSVATIDGQVDASERKVLERVVNALRVEIPLPEVTVQARIPGPTAKGFRIPPPPAAAGPALDMRLVQQRLKETAEVSALLADVFDDEGEATLIGIPSFAANGLRGLDGKHSAFARECLAVPEWSRAALETVAKRHGLMLDGALEALNEAAFDSVNSPVTEGEDPVTVVSDSAKEFLSG